MMLKSSRITKEHRIRKSWPKRRDMSSKLIEKYGDEIRPSYSLAYP
jgi:hypothetical protein